MCICNHNKIHVQFMHLTPCLSEDKYYHYQEYVTESLLKRVFKTNADGALPTKEHILGWDSWHISFEETTSLSSKLSGKQSMRQYCSLLHNNSNNSSHSVPSAVACSILYQCTKTVPE